MKPKKKFALLIAGLLAISSITYETKACTGAKQIGTGGTGITTAENAHCPYWNPGLSAKINHPELSYTKLVQGEGNYRYNDVLSFAMPAGEKFGLSYQYSSSDVTKNPNSRELWKKHILGAGTKVSSKSWPMDFYLGADISLNDIKLGKILADGTTKFASRNNNTHWDASLLGIKKEIFSKKDELRFGILVQYIDDSKSSVIRPEISYVKKEKSGDLTIAIQGYDLSGKRNALRTGIEKTFNTELGKISLRTGYDGTINLESKKIVDKLTFGIGYDSGNWGIELANSGKNMTLVEAFWRF